jgi:xylulokinase
VTATTLGVDLGSHGARAVVVDGDNVVATTSSEYGPPRPPARRSASAWWDAFAQAVITLDPEVRDRVEALGVTGVRGAVVGVDVDHAAITPAYPDFDSGAVDAARLLNARYGDTFLARTACFAFPLAGLPKMMQHADDKRVHAWLGPQDYISMRLTGHPRLTTATAFRFGILRADATDIDRDLLAEVGIAPRTIPELVPVGGCLGRVKGAHAATIGLPEGIPIIAVPGDVPAALYAVTRDRAGRAFLNLGTTIVATTVVPRPGVVHGMSCEVLPGGHRAAETGRGAGAVTLEWCAALLGCAPEALDAKARGADADAVPRLDPDLLDPWGDGAGGVLHGIVPDCGPAELAAATLEAVARAASESVDELVGGVGALEEIVVGGGASNCDLVVERLARARNEHVLAAAGRELAAEGAARVAARAIEGVAPE